MMASVWFGESLNRSIATSIGMVVVAYERALRSWLRFIMLSFRGDDS